MFTTGGKPPKIERVSPASGVDYHVVNTRDDQTESSSPASLEEDVAQLARIGEYLEEHHPETVGMDVDVAAIDVMRGRDHFSLTLPMEHRRAIAFLDHVRAHVASGGEREVEARLSTKLSALRAEVDSLLIPVLKESKKVDRAWLRSLVAAVATFAGELLKDEEAVAESLSAPVAITDVAPDDYPDRVSGDGEGDIEAAVARVKARVMAKARNPDLLGLEEAQKKLVDGVKVFADIVNNAKPR